MSALTRSEQQSNLIKFPEALLALLLLDCLHLQHLSFAQETAPSPAAIIPYYLHSKGILRIWLYFHSFEYFLMLLFPKGSSFRIEPCLRHSCLD